MASMNFTSFSISKANIPPQPSLSFPQKASRVCFTSASQQSQRTYASEGANYVTGKSLSEMGGDAKEKLKEGQKAAGEVKDGSMANLKKATDQAGGIAKEAADKIGDDTKTVVEKATSAKDQAIDAVGSVAEKTQKAVEGAWDAAIGAFDK